MSVLDKLLEDLSSTSDFVFTLMCELWGLRLHIYEKKKKTTLDHSNHL